MRRRADDPCSSLLRHQKLCGDHEQRQAADELQVGQSHHGGDDDREDDPQHARRRPCRASCPRTAAAARAQRQAIATTSALSPDNRMLIQTIFERFTQNCGWVISAPNCCEERADARRDRVNPTTSSIRPPRAARAVTRYRNSPGTSGWRFVAKHERPSLFGGLRLLDPWGAVPRACGGARSVPTIRTATEPSADATKSIRSPSRLKCDARGWWTSRRW